MNESWSELVNTLQRWIDGFIAHLPNIAVALVVMVISIFVSRYIKRGARKALLKTTDNGTVIGVVSNIVTAAFLIFILFVVLAILDLDQALTSLLAGAGVVGLAIGLALQDPLINMFSGVLMSTRKYYKVGDLIETNDFFGKIQKINLRSTIIITPQGQEVIIPNKMVIQNPLINYTHNGRRRIDLVCGISYGDDLELVEKVVMDTLDETVDVITSRPVEFYFTEFGDSSINFVLRFWQNVTAQSDYLKAQHRMIIAIKKAFDKNDITIPFPIRTLDFGVVGGMRLDEVRQSNGIEVN